MSPAAVKEPVESVAAMVTVSVDESPVMVMLAPAVKVRVSEVVSATGLVPEVVAIVVKTFWSPVLVPERLEPVTAPAQAKAPVALVKVQPVEPEPPPRRISPVPVLFILKAPVPLASKDRAMLVSAPVAARVTPPAVAALAMVISLTAEAAEVKRRNSLPLVSRISAPVIAKSPEIVTFASDPVSSIVNRVFVPSVTSSWPSEAVITRATVESANEISRSQPEPILKALSTALVPLTPSISIPIKLSPELPPIGSKSTLIAETVLLVPSAPSILT